MVHPCLAYQVLLSFLMRTSASHVIDGQKSRRTLDEVSKSTDLDWTRTFAHDGRDPRSWPQTKPCRGQHALEQSYTANQHGEMCPSPTLHSSTHCSNDVSVDPVIGLANVTSERQRLYGEGGEGHDCRSRGTKPRKKKSTPQTTIVCNTVYNSGAAHVFV